MRGKDLSRRELLQTFLGLPAALAACRVSPAPFPEGALAFSPERLGHRLRDAPPPTPSEDARESVGVVIVGGGAAGLAAAYRLLKEGFEDFLLLELESAPGGTSRSGSGPLVPYPWGAHYITVPMKENRALLALLEEMGTVQGYDKNGEPIIAEEQLCRAPKERVFYRGTWYEGLYLHQGESEEDKAQLASFEREIGRLAALRDARGRRAFALPMAYSTDDAELLALDRISMAQWLRQKKLSSPRLLWYVDYACRDDYGTTPEETSAWAGLFYFASRLKDDKAEEQQVITWPEGNGRLITHLFTKVKSRVRLGWAAADILPKEDALEVIALSSTGEARLFSCAQVIFAAPHFLTPYLIRPYREQAPAHVSAFQYSAWMVANLSLNARPKGQGFPLSWDNVLYESPSLGYVAATHQRGLDYGPTVLTYYYPLCDTEPGAARSRLLSLGWREWADVTLSDLSQAHPDIRKLVTRLDIARWGHAMVRPVPGFLFGGAREAASRPYRNIFFAHSDLSGFALFEEAFYHGTRAAEEVLSARGLPVTSVL